MADDNFKLKSPLKVTLNVTNRCNFRCIHCYNDSSCDWNREQELSFKEIRKLLRDLKEMKVFLISLNGGEPFLRSDIFDILSEIKKLGFIANLNTNASLITKQVAERISSLGMKSIDVSLHADNEKHFSEFTCSDFFNLTIAGIKNLVRSGVRPSIAFVVTSVNIGWAPNVIKLAKRLGVDSVHTIVLVERGRAAGTGLTVSMRKLKKSYEEIVEQAKKSKIDLFLECPFNLGEGLSSYGIKNMSMDSGCFGGRYIACVQANGNVTPCALFPDYVVENIRNRKFSRIWNSANISVLGGKKYKTPEKCRNCGIFNQCRGGCPTSSYSSKGFQPDTFCTQN